LDQRPRAGPFDENVTPFQLRWLPAAIEQNLLEQAALRRCKPSRFADPSGDLFSAKRTRHCLFHPARPRLPPATSRVSIFTHFSKSFMCGDSQSTVRQQAIG